MRELLDEIDEQILELLQTDGRITNADIARKIKLSPPSVLQRIRKLEDQGFISGYTALLNRDYLGYRLLVFAQISLSLHQEQPIERFMRAVRQIPEVLECHHVSGEFDFILKIVAESMSGYQKIVTEKLSTIKGVGKIQSCFVMGTAKSTTQLPLEN